MKGLLALLAVVCQSVWTLDANWTMQLPNGLQLVAGDWLRIPLDDYVNTKGSIFNVAAPGQASWLTQKITTGSPMTLTHPGDSITPSTCSVAIRPQGMDYILMICNRNELWKVRLYRDWTWGVGTASNEKIGPLGGSATLVCTDMVLTPAVAGNPPALAHIVCFDPAQTTLTLVEVDYTQAVFAGSDHATNNIVNSFYTAGGHPRLDVSYHASTNHFVYLIFDAVAPSSASTAPTAASSNFVRCYFSSLSIASPSHVCTTVSLTTLFSASSPYGAVRYLKFFPQVSPPNLYAVFAVASSNATSKSITIGAILIDNAEAVVVPTGSYASPLTVDLTGLLANADANNMLGHVFLSGFSSTPTLASLDHFILVGTTNLIYLSVNANTVVSGNNVFTVSSPNKSWVSPFECTLGTAAVPTKAFDIGGSMARFDSRLVVEYRTASDWTVLSGLAINFNYTKYGCLMPGGPLPNSVYLTSFNSMVSFQGSNYFRNKLSPDTLLSLKVDNTGTTPLTDIAFNITAKTTDSGIQTPPRNLTFRVAKTPQDYNSINLTSTSFRAYNASNFTLPISPLSFISNAPILTLQPSIPNTVVQNISYQSVAFVGPMNTPSPFVFNRAIQIDKDYTLVVLKSTSAPTYEYFSLVKTVYDPITGIPSYPFNTPSDPSKDTKIKSTDNNEIVYRVTKLYSSFCIFFKGYDLAKPKLRLNCYALATLLASASNDYPSVFNPAPANPITILSPTEELIELHYMVSNTQMRYYMVVNVMTTSANYEIRTGLITVTPSGSAAAYSTPTAVTSAINMNFNGETLIQGYYPIDIMVDYWGEIDGATLISIRMFKLASPPILARFMLTNLGSNNYELTLIRIMRISNQNLIYCPQKDEVVFFDPKARKIFSQKWNPVNAIATGQNTFYYPLDLYKISSIIQFICVPERGMFQILAKTNETPTKKIIVNFNGGNSKIGGKRVHSVIPVSTDTDFISTASNYGSLYTFASSSLNPSSSVANKYLVAINIVGPSIRVLAPAQVGNLSLDMSTLPTGATTGATAAQASATIELATAITFANIIPKIKFDLNPGAVIKIDDMVDLPGPVLSIKKDGDSTNGLELTPRISTFRRYTPSAQTLALPTRIIVEGDYMITIHNSTGDCLILGDPTVSRPNVPSTSVPVTIQELVTVKTGVLVTHPVSGDGIAVIISYSITPGQPTIYYYDIFHINATQPAPGNTTATTTYNPIRTSSDTSNSSTFTTEVDYDTILATFLNGSGLVVALAMKKDFVSNYIKLLYYKWMPGNTYTLQSQAIIKAEDSMEIGDFSMAQYKDSANPTKKFATIFGHYKGVPGFVVAHWNLVDQVVTFVKSNTSMVTPPDSANISSTAAVERMLNFNYLKCWTRFSADRICDCMIDAEGVLDFLVAIELNPPTFDNSEPLKSVNKTGEFELPPRFSTRRIDRGQDYYGFHLFRNEPLTTAPTSITKFDDCLNIVAIYKPNKNRFVYTALLCNAWGPAYDSSVDFSMEAANGKEYIYYTGMLSPLEKIKVDVLNSALLTVKSQVDATLIKLTFIGLNGENSGENKSMLLDELRFGAAPPSSGNKVLTWIIVLVVFVAIGAGGYFAWMYYQSTLTGHGTSGGDHYTSSSHHDADHSKTDLEDSRI